MEIQKLGFIETTKQTLRAMLLVDSDRQSEWMVHCWSHDLSFSFAILFDVISVGNNHHLTPRWLYRAGEGNNLYLPQSRTDDEEKIFSTLRVDLIENGKELTGQWSSSGEQGKVAFDFTPSDGSHIKATECNNWEDFKQWATKSRVESDAEMFRGHGCSKFFLRTTLHRTGRRRIERYAATELRQFSNHAEAILNQKFDLSDANDYSTILGLAQHHGLPTPLLDWTSSPYIAAFFAFSDALEFKPLRTESTHVRIYAISRKFVQSASPNIVNLVQARPFVAALDIPPRYNTRLYAQQGRFLVTNVANIEDFFRFLESDLNETYLYAADVPISFAAEALEDLAFMGVTAANLFPGLDGVGRMIRHSMMFKNSSSRPIQIQG